MGTWAIIYLSGCILSLMYGVLTTSKPDKRDLMVLASLSTLSWLSLFAFVLGRGFSNPTREEEI